ncbi:MAG: carboxypeptidase-like regulatory domain-containing protein [Planctomycetota bacterium]
MEKHGKLVVLLLVLVGLGVGGWFAFGGAGAVPTSEVPAERETDDPSSLTAAPSLSAGTEVDRGPAPARAEVAVPGAGPLDDPEIRAALAKFVGRVVSFDGKPAADVAVRFYRIDPLIALLPERDALSEPITDFDGGVAGQATTAADGRFEVAGMWPRSMYMVKADADGPNAALKLADCTPGPAETVDLGDIVLKNGGTLTGKVVDESGDPIAGAMVRAADLPPMMTQFLPFEQFDPEGFVIGGDKDESMVVEMPGWVRKYWKELPVPTTLSGEDGSFRLEGVEPGVNLVVASKAGFVDASQKNVKLDPGQERALGKLVLREGEVASGRVIDAAGKPLSGVQVVVGSRLSVASVAFGRSAGVSDERGQFECSGFKAGDVVAAARRASGEPWTITPPQSIQRSLVITLPARCALTVRLASEVGRPIDTPRLQVYSFGGNRTNGPAAPFTALGFVRPLPLEGRQHVLEDGRIQIGDLDLGRYLVMAKAAGHSAKLEWIDLAADMETELRLPAGHDIPVLVRDGDGKPIARATVLVELKNSGPDPFPLNAGSTDRDGKLTVRDVGGESAVLEATHPRYGHASVRVQLPASAPAEIVLLEPGTIEGEVTAGDQPPEPGKYMVVANRGWDDNRGPLGGMPSLTVPDLEGKFALRGLQPGKWNVQVVPAVRLRGFSSLTEMFMAARMSGDLPEQEVDLVAGRTMHVRLDTNASQVVEGPSANVSGSAFVDGRPADGMMVRLGGRRSRSTTVDATGQFDLGPVAVGHVSVTLSDDEGPLMGGGLWSKRVEVKAGEPVHLTIEVTTGSLTGEVVDAGGGRPAAGVQIILRGEEEGGGNRFARAIADSEGRFEFKRLAAGIYDVTAEGSASGRGMARVEVFGGTRATVRVQLEQTFTVRGRVDLSDLDDKNDAEERRWVWLNFEPVDETRRDSNSWGRVDLEDGTFVAKDLLPGRYRVRLNWSRSGEWEHSEILEVGNRDLEGVVIKPRQKEPPPKVQGRQNG